MIFLNNNKGNKILKGFSLVEVLVGTFLFLMVFLSIFTAYQFGTKILGQSRNKIIATAIANEQIEKIRNLPYESIGIIGGVLPAAEGILEPVEDIIFNSVEYTIKRRIEYISDENNEDIECFLNYKRAEIEIFWEGAFSGKVKMITDIAPKDKLEEISSCQAQPGGILSVKVFDAFGIMIVSPLIEVFDPETEELIISYNPIDGKKDIPLAASSYKVAVSKNGYNSDRTYSLEEIVNPIKPNPIVLERKITEISFSIDKTSAFSINTFFQEGEDDPIFISGVEFDLKGGKLIGYDAEDSPIYKYFENHVSNSQGQVFLEDLEWDNYIFSIDPQAGFELVKIEPEPNPESGTIGLAPDEVLEVDLYIKSENSLFIIVKDDETLDPVFSATTRLYNINMGYDSTLYTDENGQVLFIPLDQGIWNLEINAPGYLSYQTQVSVLGNKKTTIEIERIE